ncbi:MAG: sulfite exporter TauE/SafE family protein [Flavobacteriales bacterium]|jgi:sulfite exporter TauE/SafE|nr:MAG: sulfite exporter TauE/SafE family protein [Flavobacteriales bacterium]
MNPLVGTALLLGLAGSAHCVGMCGPIALAVPSPGNGWRARLASTLLLNAGRLATYALIGVAAGAFGHGLRLAGLQQAASIAAGGVLLLSVALPGALERWYPTGRATLAVGRLKSALARNLRRTAPEALLITGLLNGLLPCGLVYAAAIGATAMGSWWEAAAYMLLFGLGTWPLLVGLRMGSGLVGPGFRLGLRRAAPVLVGAVALLLVLRGLDLGIPYLSPAAPPVGAAAAECH